MSEDKKKDVYNLVSSMFKSDGSKSQQKPSEEASSLFKKTAGEALKKPVSAGIKLSSLLTHRKEKEFIGLDIGTSAVKALKITHHGSDKELAFFGLEEIPPSDYESSNRPEAVKKAVLKLKRSGKLDGPIVLGFHDPDVSVEFLRFPHMPAAELSNAIDWEIKERFSFDPEKSVFDYTVIGEIEAEGEKEAEVLVSMGPRQKIVDYVNLLNSIGLKPFAVEPNTLAFYEAFMETGRQWNPNEVVGVLDIGTKLTTFGIVYNDNLYLSRDSYVTGTSMTKAIIDYCQVDPNIAEMHKKNYGMSKMVLEEDRKTADVAGEIRVRIAHALGLHLDQLIADMERSFRYFSYEIAPSRFEKMDRLIMVGGGSQMKNLPEYISGRLNVQHVEVGNPFKHMHTGKAGFDSGFFNSVMPRFVTALGLALRKS